MPKHHIPEFEYQLKSKLFPLNLPLFADSIEKSLFYHQTRHDSTNMLPSMTCGNGYVRKSNNFKPEKETDSQYYTLLISSSSFKINKQKISYTPYFLI